MSYFWYQRTGGEDLWLEALGEHRQKVIAELHPAFVTVLDAHSSPDDTWGREDYLKMKYSGPLYFDWDAEDVSETIPAVQKFLVKLRDELGVNLASLRLYASGGRGFHLEVPEETFMPRVQRTGVQALPLIYKEIALELFVDTLDMRVYSARKGRMWRVPNIKRSNGLHKVALTIDEMWSMTADLYKELCATPRLEPEREAPTTSVALSAIYVKAMDKITGAVKRAAKAGPDTAALAKFKGSFPPSIERLMTGVGILPNTGFHKIAMQLAITANALGKTSDELVEACTGLIQSHASDSDRYNSPRKRKEELQRMWDYTHDNPCYEFSTGGIRSLLEPGASTADIDTQDRSNDGRVSDGEEDKPDELTEELEADLKMADRSQTAGVMVLKRGTYMRTPDGIKALSHIALTRPTKLMSAEDGMSLGFEADVFVSGKRHSRSLVPLDSFKSRAAMHSYLSNYGGTFMGTDLHAGALQVTLDNAARESGRETYIVHREGLDIVQNPTDPKAVTHDTIWAAPDVVLCDGKEAVYRFRPRLSSEPVFRTDIHHCPAITDTEDTRAWLRSLFTMNEPIVVAQMLGWFVSCFHKQFYQSAFGQFPLLHPNGPAGSGKTMTTTLLDRLFHNASKPAVYSCGVGSTQFSLKSAWTGSASVPLILDEYKPAELGPVRTDFLLQHYRLAYNQGLGASGGMSRGGASSSYRDVTQYAYSAPTAFIGESQEMQTAIVQRSLPISFTKRNAEAHTAAYDHARAGADLMPGLGNALLTLSLTESVDTRREALAPLIASLRQSYGKTVHDRQVYNLAVVLAGLDYLDAALGHVFGDALRGDIDRLRDSIYSNKAEVAVQAINETAKVFNEMALISRTEMPDSEFQLREGVEYLVGDGYIEILMRESYIKYHAWSRRKGFNPLFTSADAFIVAVNKFDALTDKVCFSSPLRRGSAQSKIYRFSLDGLTAEGVDQFRSKSLS